MHAIIFPGQGAQYSGMGKSFYEAFSQVKDLFLKADKILGFDLSKKCFTGSAEELKDTAISQVAILTVSLAAYEVSKENLGNPKYLSGLSLGEYSCLYAGGCLSLENLVILVKERAAAMQKAAVNNPSTMLAVIGADLIEVKKKAQSEGFYVANINSPKQIVVSLAKDKKEEVQKSLEEISQRVVEIEVSGGFHSPFMEEAKGHLAKVIETMDFKDAQIPIVSNFSAGAHIDKNQIKSNLLSQLVSPVLWNECVDFMINDGVDSFFEVGPSKVLRGLIRKINPQAKVINIDKAQDLEQIG